ncbi:hypothetical protein a10_06310 [Streptomyces acidiscabies]|nr:hypothetical protein a10_06310 [Streptomyces acidiscabies]
MSKHSTRRGALSRPRASAISSSARERVVRSEARFVLCRTRACWALRATVSIRARLSPRCGMRRETAAPRRPVSHSWTGSTGSGSAGTRTSLGTASPVSSP